MWFQRRFILPVTFAVLAIGGSYWLSRQSLDFSKWQEQGYFGVFLATLVGSATVFVPIPNVVTEFAAGLFLNPVGAAIAAGLGSTIGELVSFTGGRAGKAATQNTGWYAKAIGWFRQYSGLTIFLFALVPNPFFDAVAIAAGLSDYPTWRFVAFTFLGKTLRSYILAILATRLR